MKHNAATNQIVVGLFVKVDETFTKICPVRTILIIIRPLGKLTARENALAAVETYSYPWRR